jgi:hypothetical protein
LLPEVASNNGFPGLVREVMKIMRTIIFGLLVLTAFFATGCPKYAPKVDFNNKNTFARQVNDHFTAKQMEYFNATNPATAQLRRNELIEDALPYIDAAYMDFITDIQRGRDRDNFVADVIELGTTAAVGITNGQRPLHIIGIALTAFRGGRRSYDLNFYKEQTTPILINKMDGNRAKVRATILTRENDPVDKYPIGAAISDIVDYYNAGTLVRAFTELAKDTAALTQKAENNVLALKGVAITPEATAETLKPSVDAQKVLDDLRNDLKDSAKSATAVATLQRIVKALESDNDAGLALKDAGVSSSDTDGAKLRTALITIRRKAALANNPGLVAKINQAIVDNQ